MCVCVYTYRYMCVWVSFTVWECVCLWVHVWGNSCTVSVCAYGYMCVGTHAQYVNVLVGACGS